MDLKKPYCYWGGGGEAASVALRTENTSYFPRTCFFITEMVTAVDIFLFYVWYLHSILYLTFFTRSTRMFSDRVFMNIINGLVYVPETDK